MGQEGHAAAMRQLMQGLTTDNAEQVAGAIEAFNLGAGISPATKAVAAEMYSAACSSPEKGDAVAAVLAALAGRSREGVVRPLRRLLLTHCEEAFDLAPPPPAMKGALKSKLNSVNFVAALFRAGVVPAAVLHGCLGELLEPQQPGKSSAKGAAMHDLECAALLLAGAGQRLDEVSPDSRRQVDAYCQAIEGMLARGVLKGHPSLEERVRGLLALRAAGWQMEPPQAAPAPPPAAPAPSAAPAAPPAEDADEDAVNAAFAGQLSLAITDGVNGLNGAAPAALPPPVPLPLLLPVQPALPAPPAPRAQPQRLPPPLPLAPGQQPAPQPRLAAQPLAQPQQVLLSTPAPAAPPDEWDYLAPGGQAFGPFGLGQLQFWVQQGHLEPSVQVKRHSAANGWFDLATALHLEATDMLAPAVPAAPTPALPAAPLGASWGAAPGGAGAAMSPAPAVPTPGPPAVHLGRGGLGQWAGHTMPAQQMAGYQQERWPSLNGSPTGSGLDVGAPSCFAPATIPPPAPTPTAVTTADGVFFLPPLPPQQAPQQPAAPLPPRQPSLELPNSESWGSPLSAAAAVEPAVPSPEPAEPAEEAWVTAVPARRTAPPPPAPRQVQGGAGGKVLSVTRTFQAAAGPPGGRASPQQASAAGRKQKGCGYEDDKEWLVKNARGKVSGPFTGHEVLDMLLNDTLAEDAQIKKNGWKAYTPLEEVEAAILEMYSSKPRAHAKPQPQHARRDNAENAGGGRRGRTAHSSPNNAGWQTR